MNSNIRVTGFLGLLLVLSLFGSCRTQEYQAAELRTGRDFACVIISNDRSVQCWVSALSSPKLQQLTSDIFQGQNDQAQLGVDPATVSSLPLTVPLNGGRVAQLELGAEHACVLYEAGNVQCWGSNTYGQIGVASTEPYIFGVSIRDVPLDGVSVLQLSTGFHTSCVLSTDKRLKCWGRNVAGQLGFSSGVGANLNFGDESTEVVSDLPFIDLGSYQPQLVASGNLAHCILDENNVDLACWGKNMGYPIQENSIGDDPGEMGTNLTSIDLSGNTLRDVQVGDGFACVLYTDDDTLKCFGENKLAELGINDGAFSYGRDAGEMGVNAKGPNGPSPSMFDSSQTNIETYCVGYHHSCAITQTENEVKCWGANTFGGLGRGSDHTTDPTYGSAPGDIGSDQTNYVAMNSNFRGKVTKCSAGRFFTCVLTSTGNVTCWGDNTGSKLGIAGPNQYDPTQLLALQAIDFGSVPTSSPSLPPTPIPLELLLPIVFGSVGAIAGLGVFLVGPGQCKQAFAYMMNRSEEQAV